MSAQPDEIGDLDPTTPIEEVSGGLAYYIYGQDGKKVRMTVRDTPHFRRFIVWLRKFDRAGPVANIVNSKQQSPIN